MYLSRVLVLAPLPLALWALLTIPAFADSTTSVQMLYSSGDIEGFVQTPSGGRPGTTIAQRPELGELGISSIDKTEFEIAREGRLGRFYAAYDQAQMTNRLQLERDLLSQATYLSTGEEVDAQIKLDLYRLGYARRFYREFFGNPFVLYPGVELVLFNFQYEVDRTAAVAENEMAAPDTLVAEAMPEVRYGDIHRAYNKTGLRLGARAEYQLGRRWAFTGELLDSLDIDSQPQVLSANLGLRYRLFESARQVSYLHANLGMEILDYKDEQPVPNHIRAEYKNLASLGFSVAM
jgi:hypothetical protein